MEAMTLAFADALQSMRLKFKSGNDVPVERATITRREWDAITAYLAQPAQAVDVPAIRGVIGSLHRKMITHGDFYWDAAERLISALSGEKAGSVGDGLVREARRCVGAFEQFAGKRGRECDPQAMHLVICEAHNGLSNALPASPTPDKEVEG